MKSKQKGRKVTKAHLVVYNTRKHAEFFDKFGTASGYSTDFDGNSERNHIPLCGTLGDKGSCHNAFDKFKMTFLDPSLFTGLKIRNFT